MVALSFKQNSLVLVVSGVLREDDQTLEIGLSQAMETVLQNFNWYWLLEFAASPNHRKYLILFIIINIIIKQKYGFCLQNITVHAQVKRKQVEIVRQYLHWFSFAWCP